jgi:hypothetical protein
MTSNDDILMQRIQEAKDAGEPLRVTLSKEEIEDYAIRRADPDEPMDDTEIAHLDAGDILAVLKRTAEVGEETYQAVLRILKMQTH